VNKTKSNEPPSFTDWLATKIGEESPVGDLAEDAKRDKDFPEMFSSYLDLLGHLNTHGSCHEAIEAAKYAWMRWRSDTNDYWIEAMNNPFHAINIEVELSMLEDE
jgi:hypothetical protein